MTGEFYPNYPHGSLDPQSERVLREMVAANGAPLYQLTPEQARQDRLNPAWTGPVDARVAIRTVNIPGPAGEIPLRVYTPPAVGPLPALVFFHGGGFVLCAVDEFDPFCARLAAEVGCLVISVDYRLAPEHKHPAAVEDALAAAAWVLAHAPELGGDPRRVALAGDSAGGNLTAVTARALRGQQAAEALALQVLICPWVDASDYETDSYHYFGDGPWLARQSMDWFTAHYLSHPEQAWLPAVSPLLAQDWNGLPPALVITAEFDVLRDQGAAYAARLRAAGGAVDYACYPGVPHDFVVYPAAFDQARVAIDQICAALRAAFER